jgi:hypothetical protein
MTGIASRSPVRCELGALVACCFMNAGTAARMCWENVQLCNGHSFSTMPVFSCRSGHPLRLVPLLQSRCIGTCALRSRNRRELQDYAVTSFGFAVASALLACDQQTIEIRCRAHYLFDLRTRCLIRASRSCIASVPKLAWPVDTLVESRWCSRCHGSPRLLPCVPI